MRTLADGRTRLVLLTTRPADPAAVTDTEVNAGIRLECRILKSDYRLSPTASDTIDETDLCKEGNSVTFGSSNYEGTVTVFRELTEEGLADPLNDVAWEALRAKGTHVYLVESEGKHHTETFAAADPYDLYEIITDNPQKPSDRGGYVKRTIPLGVQDAWLNGTIAAGTPPPAWAATTAYALGDFVTLTGGATLEATTAGTSGSTEPAAPASVGGTVVDGTVTWTRRS